MLTYKNVNRVTVFLLLVFILLKVIFSISFLWFIIIGIFWLTLTIIGSFHIRWNYFLKAKHYNYQVSNEVIAITFDDGIHPEFTPKVLKLLKKYNAKATFFLIGKNLESHPEILKDMIQQGHVIGNHTYSHSNDFGFLKTEEVISELQQTHTIVEKMVGLKMNLFRPAFGVTNPRINKAVQTLNLITIGWSIRSLDTTKISKGKILRRITKNIKRGDVILLHDTSQNTVEVLEQLLVFLEKRKLKSVSVDQLYNLKAYA